MEAEKGKLPVPEPSPKESMSAAAAGEAVIALTVAPLLEPPSEVQRRAAKRNAKALNEGKNVGVAEVRDRSKLNEELLP